MSNNGAFQPLRIHFNASENPDDPSGRIYANSYRFVLTSYPGHHGFWLHTATRHLLDLGVGCGYYVIALSFLTTQW